MNPIRLAVIGAGRQCTTALMPAIPTLEEFDLIAICDLKRELAERNARAFGARATYTDAARMLGQEAPEAVMVVGPPQMHEEVGLQVLEAGCHLFVEKPAAPTVDGAKRLHDRIQETGKVGQVGHMMRHADPVRIAREISGSEEFGQVLSVESKYTTWQSGPFPPGIGWGDPSEDWSYMINQGGHPIDLIRHFIGDIARVAAFRAHGQRFTKVYQVAVESRGGKTGFLNLQDSFDGWTTALEIVGDRQAIVRVDDLGRVVYRRGEKRTGAEADTWGNTAYTWEPHHTLAAWKRTGYGNQLRHWAHCIRTGEPAYPSLRDGWRNLLVGHCILESYRTGQVVEVPVEGNLEDRG